MSVLDVRNLSVQYLTENGASEIVKDISFKVEKGEIAGLVGESGSGKSTAMLAVMGLLGDRAVIRSAQITVSGERPVPGKNAAMIFQDSLSCLNPSVKIGRQITETVRARRKCSRKEAEARAEELLDMAGIRNPALRMRQYPFELSGGMRQRVVLAIALACEPELIIADEPTTALDALVQAQILLLFKRIVRETETSMLLVSHDMGVTAAMCSRVYVMHEGQIVESGAAEDVFYSPSEEYTKRLLNDARGGSLSGYGHDSIENTAGGTGDIYGKTPVFRMEHVTKIFDESEGIRDLSLEIRKGEILALVGESGSGKTTAARILTGILKEDGGTLYYRGNELNRDRRMDAFAGRVQMVFQDPYASLNPCLTVREALEEALEAAACRKSRTARRRQESLPARRRMESLPAHGDREKEQMTEKIDRMLRLTGLSPEDADRYPRDFSGGQRQRIGIARALIVEPEILVCDEALSSLDATTREQILELIFRIQRKIGFACLFISHDIHMVRRISDRIGVMYGGQIVETGETKKICSDPWHPYTKQLIEAVPEPDPLRAVKIKAAPLKDSTGEGKGIERSGCPFAGRCGYALECCGEENPESYSFDGRGVSCFLYSDRHSGRRSSDYKMTSQI
ncbi:MAG TPA: ABC transporter ATP-binding protein [Candidatus Mediterraneibacter faecavium]|uniref:Nickel import system ATP-binding protein NikD n=1 Tax=Candidatus Mediterraneibacter faecavium TaxID=2838668 RepID=A0A9D2TN71_9FIRM|nr:ABC transporter ATP-binding protein [Candidatus Mediterraneibacter faecavium]